MSESLDAMLVIAANEGWRQAHRQKPAANKRVEVMHILARSYDSTGEVDERGNWHCSNGFVLPSGQFTFNPTHWRDQPSRFQNDQSREVE